jgi:putative membrane protein
MIQHLLLQMVAIPLILLGTPIVPIMRGWPVKVRRLVIIKIIQNKMIRRVLWFATRPIISLLIYTIFFWLWHLPILYEAAIKHESIHQLEHLIFIVISALYWSVIIDPKPLQTHVAYSRRLLIIIAGAIQNIALGSYLTIYPHILYPWYTTRIQENFWLVTSPIADQQLAGLIMWVPGTMMYLIALLVLLGKLLSSEEKSTREREMQIKNA